MTRDAKVRLGVAAVAAVVVVAGAVAWRSSRSTMPLDRVDGAAATPAIVLVVPHVRGPIILDGHLTDEPWLRDAVRTKPFAPGRPYSEARFLWGDGRLYVGLYASDEDIRATHDASDSQVWRDDSFRLAFDDATREYLFDVSALGTLADGVKKLGSAGAFDYGWKSGAIVTSELEGTVNAPDNSDEEWVIEMAIPLESLGLSGVKGERINLWLSRCDTPKSEPRTCTDWGRTTGRGALLLD